MINSFEQLIALIEWFLGLPCPFFEDFSIFEVALGLFAIYVIFRIMWGVLE